MIEHSLSQTLAAYISAGLGALLAVVIGVSHRQLCVLISIAAGALLSVTGFHIIPEAWEAGLSAPAIALSLLSGYLLFYVLSHYVSHMCPACAASHFEHQPVETGMKNVFLLMAVALTIHSMMDGLAIALMPHMGHAHEHSIFLTIAIHKLPEGLALCALLLKAGHGKVKALVISLFLEVSTLAGWGIGQWLAPFEISVFWLNRIMLHIAGGFVFLALHAVINEAKDHSPKLILICFLFGLIFMALVQ